MAGLVPYETIEKKIYLIRGQKEIDLMVCLSGIPLKSCFEGES